MSGKTWVTLALNEVQAIQALVLGRSLRRVVTKWNLLVITNGSLSTALNQALESVFDGIVVPEGIKRYRKNGDIETPEILEGLYGRLFCWNLPLVKRCVFLEPDVLILKNCDELLDTEGFTVAFDKNTDNLDGSLFICEPSWKKFDDLAKICLSSKTFEIGNIFKTYFGKGISTLDQNYFISITLHNSSTAMDRADSSIVRLKGIEPGVFGQLSSSCGNFAHIVVSHWMEIYEKDISPMLHMSRLLPSPPQKSLTPEPIAIVGMGCRFPGANSLEEFWNLLIQGQDGITTAPEFRQNLHLTEVVKSFQAGFLKCPVDEFDGKFFGISPMELTYLDPQTRLLLEVLWEALENAGIDPSSIKGTDAGIFTGTWTQDYRELLNHRNNEPTEDYFRKYMGNAFGAAAGRLSFILGVSGPNIATESGCSSSMIAVDMACKSLRLGETNLGLACGANLILHNYTKNDMGGICAPDGHCKTFDAAADGFGRAEGCGVLILKRYSDAVKDGDRIHALIRGMGSSQEGMSRSLGTPTVKCEAGAMKTALNNAGVVPSEVSFVECHGTGTPVGDPMEIAAIAEAYSKNRSQPLIVGSVKTNIGHTESCSGIAGIIKTVLAMQNEVIPPHLNFQKLNPDINLDAVPARIPLSPVPWPRVAGKPRYAGVSSFGITGTDAHAIIQEGPAVQPKNFLDLGLIRPQHVLTLSAKNEAALESLLQKYKEHLESQPTNISMGDIAFTANTGRAHFPHRIALLGKTSSDVVKNIDKKAFNVGKAAEEGQKICFLFTGQGSQYVGMGKALYESSPEFRYHFSQCESILRNKFELSILPVLWGESKDQNEQISRTIYSQTSIFCIEYSLFKLWESWGVKPDYVLGHSLGEFAAATAAGILSLEDSLTLVAVRSQLIDNLPGGKMIVIKADSELVTHLLKQFKIGNEEVWLDVAAINSKEQTVLAGDSETVLNFADFCKNNRITCVILEATHAFHSRHMNPMLQEYGNVASKIQYKTPTCKFISGMEGTLTESNQVNSDYWVRHTRESVQFMKACKVAFSEGCRTFIEIGPQPVLSALALVNSSDSNIQESLACLPSLRKGGDDWFTILTSLSKLYVSGANINWPNFDKYYWRRKVTLPTYPFQRKKHWFELKSNPGGFHFSGSQIHPLVGHSFANATSTSIYNGALDLNKFPYVRDHKIGDLVIFPAAGFLEMSMASGYCTTQGLTNKFEMPATPISFENLVIEAPLQLLDSEICPIQVTVTPEDETSGSKITVYRERSLEDGTRKWIRHTTGHYFPFALECEAENKTMALINNDLAGLQNRLQEEGDAGKFYEELDSHGLKFGEKFQSVKRFWKNKDTKELLAEIPTPPDCGEYLCHPVLIDAMLQTFMANKFENLAQLHVPIRIEKFVWLSSLDGLEESPKVFAYSFPKDGATVPTTVVLYDSKSKPLALMTGAELVSTSVESILSVINNQNIILPPMYENLWKALPGPLEHRIDMAEAFGAEIISGECNQILSLYSLRKVEMHEETQAICYLYVLKAFQTIGWTPAVGIEITASELCTQFGIKASLTRFVNRLLMILDEEGKLDGETNDLGQFTSWKVVSPFPSEDEIAKGIESILTLLGSGPLNVQQATQVVKKCGEKLSAVLLGTQSAVELLFTKDVQTDEFLADIFYRTISPLLDLVQTEVMRDLVRKVISSLPQNPKGVLQILELGAGTGALTKLVLPVLEELNCPYHYTYTDISAGFFINAERNFEPYGKKMSYKVLDLEKDPLEQGFAPGEFDMILSVNVLHVCKDLAQCVQTISQLLAPGGLLYISETTRPMRTIDLVFGLTDGYWVYEDLSLRPNHCTISLDKWKGLLLQNGCDEVFTYLLQGSVGVIVGRGSQSQAPYPSRQLELQPKTWILFSGQNETTRLFASKLKKVGRNVVEISQSEGYAKRSENSYQIYPFENSQLSAALRDIKEQNPGLVEGILYLWGDEVQGADSDQKLICEPFLYLTQHITTGLFNPIPKLIIATTGSCQVGDHVVTNPSASTLWGFARSLRGEASAIRCKSIDLDPNTNDIHDCQSFDEKVEEAFTELWRIDGDYQVAYRGGKRLVPRLHTFHSNLTPLTLPNSDRFSLALPASRAISDVRLIPNSTRTLQDDEVEVQIRFTALNFRDIFTILKPSKEFENLNSVGIDFAGVVTALGKNVTNRKVGDPVCGCNYTGTSMASHAIVPAWILVSIPKHWTFAEAATLPVVFSTAYYCMVIVANLQRGEMILVHAASGGVGLCAIQLAKYLGAKVIATAGSSRKRAYLKNLGVQHIFNSRTLDYEQKIMEVTKGKGVDMVLNCLTGPGFKEASLNVLSKGGRFVEMSKLDVWNAEEVAVMRPDVKYTYVDLTIVPKDTWDVLVAKTLEYMETNVIKPIPYTRFDLVHVRDGLNYLLKAKHIGKVVVEMPVRTKFHGVIATKFNLFNKRSSYLITGGLGGIGLEVAKWMAASGAKHLVLVGRKSPSPQALEIIQSLTRSGTNVLTFQTDVSNFEECQSLLKNMQKPEYDLPPLRGIMHAAGTISDALIGNQTWSKFESTFGPKVQGAWNLHELTKEYNLEHFVMYSSVVALFGNFMQTNHAAANSYLDALAFHRNSTGLPALSVNWGQWGEVGVAAEMKISGFKPFSPKQGINALELLMKAHTTQGGVVNADLDILRKGYPHLIRYLEEMKSKSNSSNAPSSLIQVIDGKAFREEFDKTGDEGEKVLLVRNNVERIIRQILKLDEDEEFDSNQNLSETGLDSLMMVEVKNSLQVLVGNSIVINPQDLANHQTSQLISVYITSLLVDAQKNSS